MRTKNRLLISAGTLAAVVLAAGCVPPNQNPPGGSTTTTQPPPPGVASCPAAVDGTAGPNNPSPIAGAWGVDGTALATVVINNVVYVGGSFNNAIAPAGSPAAAHTNLAAFCLADGQLLNTFNANFGGGPVNALATDGSNLYVGGNFTTLNGSPANRLVKLSAAGGLDGNFTPLPIPAPAAIAPPNPEGILSLAYSGGVIYAAGDFGKIGTGAGPGQFTQVDGGAGFNATTGVLTAFNAGANPKRVDSIAVSPDGLSVYIGGNFNTVHGQAHNNVAKLDVNGVVAPINFGDLGARPLDLAVSSDNSRLFAAVGPKDSQSSPAGAGRRLMMFNTGNGAALLNDPNPKGDPQAVEVVSPSRVFFGMLLGYGVNTGPEVIGIDPAQPVGGATYVNFQPPSESVFGAYDLAQGNGYFVAVGDFTTVGGVTGLHGVAIYN